MNEYKFTGQEYDEENSLQYYGARYLDNEIGRFTAIDPALIYEPQNFLLDPQQLNNYSYTRNNPVRYIDPTGKYTVETDDNDKTRLIIEQGDTLSHVAQFFGMDYNELAGNLGIDDPNRIYAGDTYDVTPLMLGSVMINLGKGYSVRVDHPAPGSNRFHAHLYKNGQQLKEFSQDLYGEAREGRSAFPDKIQKELENNKKWNQKRDMQDRWNKDHDNKGGGSSAGGDSGLSGGGRMITPGTNFFFMPIMSAPMPMMFNMPSLMPSPALIIP